MLINKKYLSTAFTYIFLFIITLISIFPFYWMLAGATNESVDIILGKATFGNALMDNVQKFFQQVDVPLIFWNSTKISVISTVLTLLISSIAGYGFEMFRSRAREVIYNGMLLTLMIPFAALMIPLFITMAKFGIVNTHAAVIIPTIASAFIIFYFRQSTIAFPSEIRDAAKIDGLKEWQIFFFIYVPVMKSTFAAALIIVFMATWNSYLWPLIVLQTNEVKTITLVISSLASGYSPDFGVIMVGTILATIPTIIIFFLMQRQFVQGMLGSVK